MKIAVCIKQVPDTEARLRVSRDGSWLDEEDLPFVINESDEYALEEGLRLAEKTGGEVVVVSLGPERVKEALRKALAVGAARAVHLKDPAFAGGDALAPGRALAAAVAARGVRPGAHRLAVGRRGLRRHRLGARRPPRLAARLAGDGGRARRGPEGGPRDARDGERHERDRARARCRRCSRSRPASTTRAMPRSRGSWRPRRRRSPSSAPADLGLDAAQVGLAGSRLEIVSVALPAAGLRGPDAPGRRQGRGGGAGRQAAQGSEGVLMALGSGSCCSSATGSSSRMSWEAIAAAHKLAEATGAGKPEAVLLGAGLDALAAEVAKRDVGAVRVADSEALRTYTPGGYVGALAPAIRDEKPDFVVFPHTYQIGRLRAPPRPGDRRRPAARGDGLHGYGWRRALDPTGAGRQDAGPGAGAAARGRCWCRCSPAPFPPS